MKKFFALLLLLVLVFSMTACGKKENEGDDTGKLRKIKYVVPRSTECLDDAHFWAAYDMGYFEEEGLDVIIEQSMGTTDVKMVTIGQAEFCVPSPIGLITAHEAGMDLISVMQCDTVQIYGICVRADSDIYTPADMKGHSIVLGDSSWQPEFDVFVEAAGVDLNDVSYVVGGENRAQMVDMGQADCVYTWEKEYQLWMAQGMDFRYISFQDIYPACANSVVTTQEIAKNDPELVEKFCRAYAKGIYFCKCNPLAAADIVVKHFPSLNLTKEEALPAIEGLVKITNDADTEKYGYGWHDEYEWQLNKDGGLATDCFTEDLPVTIYYTNDFVAAINNFDKAKVEADAKNYKFN